MIWVNWGVRKDLLNIHPSLRHAHSPRGDEPGLAEPVPGTRSEVIGRGSWGAEVVDEIHPGDRDIQIVKHRFSAFWDTETDLVFATSASRRLLIGGVNMDQCVMTTLEDSSFLGYDTVLIEDATATTSPDYCVQATLYNVKLLFGFVTARPTFYRIGRRQIAGHTRFTGRDGFRPHRTIAGKAHARAWAVLAQRTDTDRQFRAVPPRREPIFLAGQICEWNGEVKYRGKLGSRPRTGHGQEAARICALNLLAALREACGGSLNRVTACLRVGGFVNCSPDYEHVPQVINGASDLFRELFGERGLHRAPRSASRAAATCRRRVDAIFVVD